MVSKLSEIFKVDVNLITDFIENETSIENDEITFNNKFQ
jgi:hypothetical protein